MVKAINFCRNSQVLLFASMTWAIQHYDVYLLCIWELQHIQIPIWYKTQNHISYGEQKLRIVLDSNKKDIKIL